MSGIGQQQKGASRAAKSEREDGTDPQIGIVPKPAVNAVNP